MPDIRVLAVLLNAAARIVAVLRCAGGQKGELAVNSPATSVIADAHIA